MHVAFTTDVGEDRATCRWALRHLLTCRGWFLRDDESAAGRSLTIHYGDSLPPVGPMAAPVLQIERGTGSMHTPPPRPAMARNGEGRKLLASYPGTDRTPPPGEHILWSRENGSPLATLTNEGGPGARVVARLHADVLQPVVFLMSRVEERDGARDSLDRFDPDASWLKKHGLLDTPVIDEIGWLIHDLLGSLLERAGAWSVCRAAWPRARSHAIAITHDQDQSIRWERRLARHALGLVRGPDRGRQAVLFLRDLREGAVPATLLTERLMAWERERDVEATYFFLAVPKDRFGRRYDVSSSSFRRVIGTLAGEGHTVGLHASLRTYKDKGLLLRERSMIHDVLGREPAGVRQHYLRIQLPDTWSKQEEAGFRYDASLGYPDESGFRAGTSYPFFPEGLPSFLAFPLTGMDRALMARGLTAAEAWHRWAEPARRAQGLVDVLWHPYFIDSDLGADRESATIAMLDWASSSGAWVAGLDRIDTWWRARGAFRLVETTSGSNEERAVFRAGLPVHDLALTLEGADSDIRIAGTDGIRARWAGTTIVLHADAGGTMTLSRKTR